MPTQNDARYKVGAAATCGAGATVGVMMRGERAVAVEAVGICTMLGARIVDATVRIGGPTSRRGVGAGAGVTAGVGAGVAAATTGAEATGAAAANVG